MRRNPAAIVVVAILDLALIGPVAALVLLGVDALAAGGLIAFGATLVGLTAAGLALGLASRSPERRVRYRIAWWAVVLAAPVALLASLIAHALGF